MSQLAKCTFTPLKGGRYRWNQGPRQKPVILRRGRLEGFRRELFYRNHIPPPPLESFPVVTIGRFETMARCPHCRRHNVVWDEGPVSCDYCQKRFIVKEKRMF